MALDRKRPTRRSLRHRSVPTPEQTRRPPASKCKNCCRKFIAFLLSHVGLCVLLVGYAIGGAFIFQYLEAPFEDQKSTQVIDMRNITVQRLWNITYSTNVLYKENWTQSVRVEIKEFQSRLFDAIKDGYEGKELGNKKWSFSGSFLFSLTVISTIGYGNISPRTDKGKIMTILYAIIGIPLMLLYLTNIGDILAKSFRYLYGKCIMCKRNDSHDKRANPRLRPLKSGIQRSVSSVTPSSNQRPHMHFTYSVPNSPTATLTRHSQGTPLMPGSTVADHHSIMGEVSENRDMSELLPDLPNYFAPEIVNGRTKETTRVHVPITLCLLIMTCYICGGGALFSIWENWEFLDGSYFCFVTLSTIGFGDLVPGSSVKDEDSQGKLVICSLYLLAGMALLAMCFNLMQEKVIHKLRNCGKRIGIIRDTDVEDDDEFDML